MYTDTVTLFNRYQSRLGDTWYPSILRNVQLNMDKAAITAKYGPESSDSAVLNVHFSVKDLEEGEPQCEQVSWLQGKKAVISNKIWLPPTQWDSQPNDSFAKTLTFTDGTDFDFFMLGEWQGGEDPIADDDYMEGLYNELNKRYTYVFAITSIAGPYPPNTIAHFEIMGR